MQKCHTKSIYYSVWRTIRALKRPSLPGQFAFHSPPVAAYRGSTGWDVGWKRTSQENRSRSVWLVSEPCIIFKGKMTCVHDSNNSEIYISI